MSVVFSFGVLNPSCGLFSEILIFLPAGTLGVYVEQGFVDVDDIGCILIQLDLFRGPASVFFSHLETSNGFFKSGSITSVVVCGPNWWLDMAVDDTFLLGFRCFFDCLF